MKNTIIKNIIYPVILLFLVTGFTIKAQNSLVFTTDIKILPKSVKATSEAKGTSIKKSIDGNVATYYLSKKGVFPVTLTYNFTQGESIDYIQYQPPYQTSDEGKFTEFEVWYSTNGKDKTKLGDFKPDVKDDYYRMKFPARVMNVTSIELRIKSAVGDVAGCSEIEFFRFNPEKIVPSTGFASSFHRSEGIEKSFDGDFTTIYHSHWGDTEFPVTLRYNFSNAPQIDYLVYNPRMDATNGLIKKLEVWYTTKSQTRTKLGDFDFKGESRPNKIVFPQPLIDPVNIEFIVKSGVGDNGTGFVSCAEMEFFRQYPNSFDLSNIFADNLCTRLKPGVGSGDIEKIPNLPIRKLAQQLLQRTYETEFRVATFKAYQHPDIMAKVNKTNPYSLRDNPAGISVKKGEELVVFAGDLHGQNIGLVVQNLDKSFGGVSYALAEGVNILKMTDSGLVYVMYLTDTGTEQPVDLHFASGVVNGYFDSRKHTAADWKRLLENATDTYFDVLGQYAHLTFNTNDFRQYTPDGQALINVYDKIASLQQDFMGLNKYNKQFNNRIYLHTVYGNAYMFATSYHTAYHQGTLKNICDVSKLTGDPLWGPAHEIGHCNQTRPGLKWHGMTEVTTNIYSLATQAAFGNRSRLIDEKMRDYANRYEKAVATIVDKKIAHNTSDDVFCKLVPFWQLKLYIHDVLGQHDFYKDVHEMVRLNPDPATAGECQLQFVKFTCQAAKLDMTGFFEKWGFLTPVDTMVEDYGDRRFTVTQQQVDNLKEEIKALGYPKPQHDNIHLINDDNLNDYTVSLLK